MYIPIGSISEEGVYKDGEVNALINMLYDTTEINGYTIINKYEQSGFSIVMKPGVSPVILHGEVFDIRHKSGSVEIHTREKGPNKIYGAAFPRGAMYVYLLTKDLKRKKSILEKLNLFNHSDIQEEICKIHEIDRLVFNQKDYSNFITVKTEIETIK